MPGPRNHSRDDTFDTSDDAKTNAVLDVLDSKAQTALKLIIARVENVNREITDAQEARKEILAEAKGLGFEVKIIRKVVARRKMDKVKRTEEEDRVEMYEAAIGDEQF